MKENWKIGNHNSTVVSDTVQRNTNFPSPPNPEDSSGSDLEYYGGHLVCESIGSKKQAQLIAAAPDLLRCLENLSTAMDNYWNSDVKPDSLVKLISKHQQIAKKIIDKVTSE